MAIYLSLGLHKGLPSYRRSLQPSKENIQNLKHENSGLFSIFWGHFCPPGSGSVIWMRIRIRIQQLKLMRIHPDPKPWKKILQLVIKTLEFFIQLSNFHFSIIKHQKPKWNRCYRTYPDPEPEEDVVTLECAHGCVISTKQRGHHFFTKANCNLTLQKKNDGF